MNRTIRYKFDANGGFYATDGTHVEYAYPSSDFARMAVKHPENIAAQMMEDVQAFLGYYASLPGYFETQERMRSTAGF